MQHSTLQNAIFGAELRAVDLLARGDLEGARYSLELRAAWRDDALTPAELEAAVRA